MRIALVLVLGFALAAATYGWLEGVGRRGWLPAICRGIAWSCLGLLLVNASCPSRRPALQPLVLLDGSLSMAGVGGRWDEARDTARALGEVVLVGVAPRAGDTLPSGGRSDLRGALEGAAAGGRAIVVVTDGEVTDAADLPADLLGRATVRVFPRAPVPDVSISSVSGAGRLLAGDSLRLEADLSSTAMPAGTAVEVRLRAGGRSLATGTAQIGSTGRARIQLVASTRGLAAGDQMVEITVASAEDREPRNDLRLHRVQLSATPGLVLLASPADWDARALYRALADVTEVPVHGYAQVAGRWLAMDDLRPVAEADVARSARGADLVVLKGDPGPAVEPRRSRGLIMWSSGERGESVLGGDWYVTPGGPSPLAPALLGLPVDSFPPLRNLTPLETDPAAWVALVAQEGRRGPQRPVIVGTQEADGRRRIVVAADGLWRWAFGGGAGEQAYRGLVDASVSWLLSGRDSTGGSIRPARPVVANGRPLTFLWSGVGSAPPQAIVLDGPDGTRRDTLAFDGMGRADLWLSPGTYRWRTADGAGGLVAVETYSEEWMARPVTLRAQEGRSPAEVGRTSAREWLWLFGLCLSGLAGEWLARRRLGLR